MGANVEGSLTYYVSIPERFELKLFGIRHWPQIMMAKEGETLWLRGFNLDQLNSKELLTIPSVSCFYSDKGKLFGLDSLLPARVEPSLLWSPLTRLLKLTLPTSNSNFFGINEKIQMGLLESSQSEPVAMIKVDQNDLEVFLKQASEIRLEGLQWLITDEGLFVMGKPVLATRGVVYWQCNTHFIPCGFALNFPELVRNTQEKDTLIIWLEKDKCIEVSKSDFRSLDIGSFRNSAQLIK